MTPDACLVGVSAVPGRLLQVDHFLAGEKFRESQRAGSGLIACTWRNHDHDMRDARDFGVSLDLVFAFVGDVNVVEEPVFRLG
jgi:hypothetical protein